MLTTAARVLIPACVYVRVCVCVCVCVYQAECKRGLLLCLFLLWVAILCFRLSFF